MEQIPNMTEMGLVPLAPSKKPQALLKAFTLVGK